MTCGIYKLTSPTGKIYIGQSVAIEGRFSEHKYSRKNKSQNTKLLSTLRKYNWEDIKKEIIEICEPEKLNDREIYYISVYDSFNHGLNCTTGGGQEFKRSQETIEKLRKINLNKRGNCQSKPFFIDGIRYVSILDASKKLNIPHKTIHNRLNSKNIKYSNYLYEEKSLIPERRKVSNVKKINVEIDQIVYSSALEASIKLKIGIPTILRRARSKSEKFKNYKIV